MYSYNNYHQNNKMMINRTIIKSVLIIVFVLISAKTFSQYKSIAESPLFKKDKINLFVDSSKTVYTLPIMDSLYKIGKAKFQITNYSTKGDSIFWQIKFITELASIRSKWINKVFPFSVYTDLNHNKIEPEKIKGKIVIVNCWSVTCGPCVAEMPYLNKLVDSLGEKNFAFIGLTYDEPKAIKDFFSSDKLKKYLNVSKPEFKFQLVGNQKAYLTDTLGVIGYPTTFIIDSDGVIKEILEGINLDKSNKPKVYEEIMAVLTAIRNKKNK